MVKQDTIEGSGGASNLCFANPGCYDISVGVGVFPSEITWYIQGPNPDTTQVAAGGAGANQEVCSTAADDEWTYPPTPTVIVCFQIQMSDSYGDGWNGAYYTWIDQDNNNLATGTVSAGSSGQDEGLCMYDEGCYTLKVNAGSYPYEISWTMSETNPSTGSSGGSGGAPATQQICSNSRRLSAGSVDDSVEVGHGLVVKKTKTVFPQPDEMLHVDPDYARTKAERKAMGLKALAAGSKVMDGQAGAEVLALRAREIKEDRKAHGLKARDGEANLNPIPLEILHRVTEKSKAAAKKSKVFNNPTDAMAYKIETGSSFEEWEQGGHLSSGGRNLLSFEEEEAEEDFPLPVSLGGGQRHLLSCNDDCYDNNCDYWNSVNDDYSCDVLENTYFCDCGGCDCDSGGGSSPTPSVDQCYDLQMLDTYGDGWNDALWTWVDQSGTIQRTGTLATGNDGSDVVCVWEDEGPCYTFLVDGGSYPNEISWFLRVDGVVQAQGQANDQATVCSDGSGGGGGGGGSTDDGGGSADDDADDDEADEAPYYGIDDFGYTKHDILHNLTLDNGYSGTDQICFSSEVATSRYRFKVIPGAIDEVVSWTLEGYVYGGGVEKLDIDFSEYDRCSGPGGGALHISQGSVTTVSDCTFRDVVASNSVGGAIAVKSDRLLETEVNIDGAHFKNAEAGFYGAVMYNAMGLIDIKNTYIEEDSMVYQDGIIFNAGGVSTCVSGCPEGQYGDCTPIDPDTITQGSGDATEPACFSCNISLCFDCDAGRYSASAGGVTESKSCDLCEVGKYQGDVGQGGCTGCAVGYFVTTGDDEDSFVPAGDKMSGSGIFPLGEAGEEIGATHCNVCPSGFYNNEEDQTSCDSCFSGEYSDPGSTTCSKCPPGKFSSHDDEDFHDGCKDCVAGKYSADLAAVACDSCQSGRYSTGGDTVCAECSVGKYQDFEESTQCKECDAGKYADELALTACKACPPGSQSNPSDGMDMASCTFCPNGTRVNEVENPTGCDECDPGKYSSTGATSCPSCPAGKFSGPASKTCISCQAGEYSATAATMCSQCTPGKYSNAESVGQTEDTYEGQAECLACVAGTRSDHTGEERLKTDPTCVDPAAEVLDDVENCAVGNDNQGVGDGLRCPCDTYANSDYIGAPGCIDCGIGTFQANEEGTVCEDCPAGKHNDISRRASCGSCLAGSFSSAEAAGGLVNCTFCPPGQYSSSDEAPACTDCQAGQYSTGAASGCALCGPGSYSAARSDYCLLCKVSKGDKPLARRPPHQHQPLREATTRAA